MSRTDRCSRGVPTALAESSSSPRVAAEVRAARRVPRVSQRGGAKCAENHLTPMCPRCAKKPRRCEMLAFCGVHGWWALLDLNQ